MAASETAGCATGGPRHPFPPKMGAASAEFLLVCLGFGLLQAWNAMSGSPTVFVPVDSVSYQVGNDLALPEDVLYFLLLVVVGAVAWWRRDAFSRTATLAVGSCLVLAGTVLFSLPYMVLADAFSATLVSTLSAAGRVMFAATALMIVPWGEQLCRFSIPGMLACAAASDAFAKAVVLAATILPAAAAAVLQTMLPVLSLVVWIILQRCHPWSFVPFMHRRFRPCPSVTTACVLVGVGCFGAIILLANSFSENKVDIPDETLSLVAGLVTSLAILVWARFGFRSISLTFAFRLMLPILVACIFIVFSIETGQQAYEVFMIGFSWTFFIVFAWALWGVVASASRATPACVFALGSAALSLCSLLSQVLKAVLAPMAGSGLVTSAVIILASVLVSTFLLNDQKLRVVAREREEASDGAEGSGESGKSVEDIRRERANRAARVAGFTDREREIVLCVLQEKDNPSIVSELSISSATLYTHLRNIYRKSGVHGRRELVDWLDSL